jgi:tetratricopeptide (TPR) repeat protein
MVKQQWDQYGKTESPHHLTTASSTPIQAPTSRWNANKQSVVFMVRADVKKELERGKRNFEDGDYEGARESYEHALDLDPACAIAYFYLGFTYHEMGTYDLAKDHYLQAIEIEKKQSLFLEHLARLHFELEEYSVCLVRFQEAQAVGPLQPISYGLMGRANYELDRYPEAVDCLEKMLEVEEEPRLRRIAYYYLVLAHLKDQAMLPARKWALKILAEQGSERLLLSSLSEKFQTAGCLSLSLDFLHKLEAGGETTRDRIEEVEGLILRAESRLAKIFVSDEEKLLHHLHFISQAGTDRIYRILLNLLETPTTSSFVEPRAGGVRVSPSSLVREGVISYCRKFGYPISPATLATCLGGSDLLREATLLYLAETFEADYTEVLVKYLNAPSREIQLAVARFLERCGKLEHLPLLEGQMEISIGPALRRQLQRAINQIKRRHTEQTDKLIHRDIHTIRKEKGATRPGFFGARSLGVLQWIFGGLVVSYLVFRLVFLVS